MIFWEIIGSLIGALAGIIVYIYYLRKGQFEDNEDVKYEMFRSDKENH